MIYVLYVCMGLNAAGCAVTIEKEFHETSFWSGQGSARDACLVALRLMRVGNGTPVVAFCHQKGGV